MADSNDTPPPPMRDEELSARDRPPDRTVAQYLAAAFWLVLMLLPAGLLLMIALAIQAGARAESVICSLFAAPLLSIAVAVCGRKCWTEFTGPQRAWVASRRGRRRRCYQCGYDLRGSTRICPECGLVIPESYDELAARLEAVKDDWEEPKDDQIDGPSGA